MAARVLRHSWLARVKSMTVTTNKVATISHSRAPLRLSGSTLKTPSIQFLCTRVITNKILVTIAMPVSSQKRRLNACLIGPTSPFAKYLCSIQFLIDGYQNALRNTAQSVLLNDMQHKGTEARREEGDTITHPQMYCSP